MKRKVASETHEIGAPFCHRMRTLQAHFAYTINMTSGNWQSTTLARRKVFRETGGLFAKILTCALQNWKKMDSLLSERTVPRGFPKITQNPSMKVIEKGRNAVLVCSASGDPPVNVYWVKDTMKIQPNPRYAILDKGKLRGEGSKVSWQKCEAFLFNARLTNE